LSSWGSSGLTCNGQQLNSWTNRQRGWTVRSTDCSATPLAAAAQQRQSNIAATVAVVLAHELTHWVTDRFVHPKSGLSSTAFSQYGQDGLEGDAVTEVVEGIAELATFAAINRVADANLTNSMLTCFKAGHQHLNDKYRAFDLYFEFWPLDQVVGHLIRLARRNDPNATPLKGQKDGLDFEFHWLGVKVPTEGTYPWMLHRKDSPAVVIPRNAGGQMAHDPTGWYRWPSKTILPTGPVYSGNSKRPEGKSLLEIRSENDAKPEAGLPGLSYGGSDNQWFTHEGQLTHRIEGLEQGINRTLDIL
jgi:hypothetical protein